MDVPSTVEIKMTMRGFDVIVGTRVTRFPTVEAAVSFAQEKLRWAEELREMSRRCE